MKVRLLSMVIVVLFLCITTTMFSQTKDNPIEPFQTTKPIYIGPVVGYNKSMHRVTTYTTNFETQPSKYNQIWKACDPFENGDGNGFYVGLSFEYLFGDPAKSQSSLIGRVLYNSMPASMSRIQEPYPTMVSDGTPDGYTTVWTSTQNTAEVRYNMITLEVMYKLNPIENFGLGITAGPTFDFPIKKTMYAKYQLLEPTNGKFIREPNTNLTYEDNDRTIVYSPDATIKDAASFRLALKFGLQYEIITAGRMYIVPAVFYNLGITKLTSVEDWRVNALQIGVDVRFAL